MVSFSLALLLLLRGALFAAAQGTGSGYNDDHRGFPIPGEGAVVEPTDPCLVVSPPCVSEADRHSLEALRDIHRQVDDDQDGGIEVEESLEFIIEDMKQQQTNKHSNLHREDQHITVEELWRGWKSSEVHNWTQDEVLRWLKEFVELPQYEKNFKEFRVNGNTLPRIAANEPSFLSAHLKILDQRDKQKLNIKALDVVLFGPPTRPPHNWMKDLVLMVSVVMGVGGCWFARAQNKTSKVHISKMMKDLESLQSAELSLQELQGQLERAQEEKRNVAEEKQNLEEKMRDEIMGAQEEAHRLHQLRKGAVSELSRLRYAEEELEQVRGALKRAEKDMQASWTLPEALQLWLQLTHEVEVQYYNVKKHSAELQLGIAKEEAEKIKKKRSSVLGTLHVAHSSSLDQVDHKILEAKNSLSDVTASLRERLTRWQHIERLCAFPILRNAGLVSLTATLYSDPGWVSKPRASAPAYTCHAPSAHGSEEDLLVDASSPMLSQMPAPPMKCSPGGLGSSVCRSRRTSHLTPTPSMISSDPDLLIPIRGPLPCFEEEEADIFIRRQECQEMFSDADLMGPSHLGRMFPSSIDSSSRKIFRDDMDMYADAPERKTSREELEASSDPSICKLSREELETSTDMSMESTTSRKISRDRGDAYLDAATRKTLREELEAAAEMPARNISRDSMGVSMDSASRKMAQEEFELSLDSGLRKITRDSMGLSFDLGSRKAPRDFGEILTDSPMRGMPRDKMVDAIGTPKRRISWHELEFSADSGSRNMLPRDKTDGRMDGSFRIVSREKPEFSAESSALRKISRDELEMSASSHRRRMIRDTDSSIDTPTGKIYRDRVDDTMEIPKRRISREEFVAPEPGSSPGGLEQPDLTMNPMVSWKSSDPLSQLVYDGILEKSVSTSTSTIPTGPSEFNTTTRPQSMLVGEGDGHPSPSASPPERIKEKKSKKSSKLKNLFRKKKDPTSEQSPQSGLQKL